MRRMLGMFDMFVGFQRRHSAYPGC
jgi:hypothetical protein